MQIWDLVESEQSAARIVPLVTDGDETQAVRVVLTARANAMSLLVGQQRSIGLTFRVFDVEDEFIAPTIDEARYFERFHDE
jgi:hypothetical protein